MQRLTLNYKKLPYKTEWHRICDLESVLRSRGFKPSAAGIYTSPAIEDPLSSGGKELVLDSLEIAKYLDKTYPDSKPVLPLETVEAQVKFVESFAAFQQRTSVPIMIGGIYSQQDEDCQAWYRNMMTARAGMDITALIPTEERRKVIWEQLHERYGQIGEEIDATGKGGPYFGGKDPLFQDIYVIASLLGFKVVLEPEEWQMIESWHDGRWKKLLEESSWFSQVI